MEHFMEIEDRNPFMFGKVVEDDFFCNRTSELRDLKQHIHNLYNVWLFSPRRYGKSSLVKRAFKECSNKKQHTIFFDLYNVTSTEDFCRKYTNTIAKELFNWTDDVKTITQNAVKYFKNLYPKISFNDEGSASLSLEKATIEDHNDIERILNATELIATNRNIQVCIAFDEFQEIERINPFLIHQIRSVIQYQKKVSYIFLGSRQSLMDKIFTNVSSPLYESAVKVDIGTISHKDFSKYIKTKFESCNIPIHQHTINTILEKSELHPHFTQYFASVVFNHIKNGHNPDTPDFNKQWMDRIIAGQSIIFLDIFDRLSTIQRTVLQTVSKLNANDEIFSDKLRRKYNMPPPSSTRSALISLEKQGLIVRKDKKYKTSNPVMREWLIQL